MTAILQLPRTVFASGAVKSLTDELRLLGVQKPLIVTDGGIVRAGLLSKVSNVLDNINSVVFDQVTENNVFADADNGAVVYKASQCDCVIGLGGGSVLDTAKCIAVLAVNSGVIADFALHPDKPITKAAPIIAIPTTAGTGSDADIYAGIHPDSISPGVGIASHHIVPKVTILDPDLTITLPPYHTAATGIDALSHCIEGYLSREDVPFAKLIALDGLRRGIQNIRRAVSNGQDMSARAEMLLVAYAGGVAMSMGTGPAHAIALTCSDQGFPHGILSGIGIVMTLDVVLSNMPEARLEIAKALNADPDQSLAAAFADLMHAVSLPSTLAELGYKITDIEKTITAAHGHFLNGFAVHPLSIEQYRAIFEELSNAGDHAR